MTGTRVQKRLGVLVAAAAALVISGCATGNRADAPEPFTRARPSSIRVIVQNRNFSDARLYTYRRGTRQFLGSVTGKQDGEFTVDWNMTGPLAVEIGLIAGPKCLTREMQVDPGDILELQIAPVFTSSTFCR